MKKRRIIQTVNLRVVLDTTENEHSGGKSEFGEKREEFQHDVRPRTRECWAALFKKTASNNELTALVFVVLSFRVPPCWKVLEDNQIDVPIHHNSVPCNTGRQPEMVSSEAFLRTRLEPDATYSRFGWKLLGYDMIDPSSHK